ncbi:MAG: hypothetical protein EA378_05430 [Phycisphaerales bacterium]|nr:MAG: hypothetical protein EA378_05430 [Phycisphaerales bacterium]
MKRINPRWRDHGIGVVVLLAVIAIGWSMRLSPAMSGAATVASLQREASERQFAVQQQNAEIAAQTATVARLRAELERSEQSEATSKSLNERIASLGRQAEGHGLRLTRMDAAAADPRAGGGSRRVIELEGEGTFPGLTQFLAEVHDRSPDCVIERFSIQRGQSGGARFSVRVLWNAPAGQGG